MTPIEQDLKRTRGEARLIKQARKLDDERRDYQTEFIWPTVGHISGSMAANGYSMANLEGLTTILISRYPQAHRYWRQLMK